MKKFITFATVLLLFIGFQNSKAQKTTGLSGWTIFIDPGHSQTENQGLFKYSEAQKTLRVALHLRDLLLNETDIDTVYLSRTNDQQNVSLTQRTDRANQLGVDFYYSIHSDAGGPDANSTLLLHGGWRINGNGAIVEKTPHGGKLMGDYIDTLLTRAMRIPRRGNYADRTFYNESVTNQYPYLHVNRETNMASVLSEAGFHTNPYQQQRNINAEYKHLEARAAYWSILAFHNAERPDAGILTGEIKDGESGQLLNGATVSIQGKNYTTDTYDAVFKNYSVDPNELHNGFYYFDDLTPETSQIIVSHDQFYSDTVEVSIINKEFNFADITLISKVSPFVQRTTPAAGDTMVNPSENIYFYFSRAMNTESLEGAISIQPETSLEYTWINNKILRIKTDSLDFKTEYTITINEGPFDASPYNHAFDGDNDGEAGGIFEYTFKTGPEDVVPPKVTGMYPYATVIQDLKPVISIQFDEVIDENSVSNSTVTVTSSGGTAIQGEVRVFSTDKRSAITFFPTDSLKVSTRYNISVKSGISDLAGNKITSNRTGYFNTSDVQLASYTVIDSFESSVSSWWEPQQSGSTTGIATEQTSKEQSIDFVNLSSGSTGALRINYGWDKNVNEHLIRLYLAPGTTPQSVKFNNTKTVQAYIYSDGSGNKFRFMLRDGASQLEGSEWFTLDWVGWKLLSWDLSKDPIIGWVNGNGDVSGNAYVDSFQLTSAEGSDLSGFIVIDDFRVVSYATPTTIEDSFADELPKTIALKQNYPNPFNPSTTIQFELPVNATVKLTIFNALGQKVAQLANGNFSAGQHSLQFDASQLSSGMYLYRLESDGKVLTKKMLLIK